MASNSYNDKNAEQSQTGKEIQESVDRALTALNRLNNISKRVARKGNNPEQSSEYWDALLDVDMAVFDAYNRMRKYLKVDREEFWNTYIIGFEDGVPVVLGGDDGEVEREDIQTAGRLPEMEIDEETPLLFLEDLDGAVQSYTVTERERFGDVSERKKYVPRLLDAEDYRRAYRVLDRARRKLGFTPKPTESTPRTEITREMIDEVEEWRRENLPDQFLPDEVTDGE